MKWVLIIILSGSGNGTGVAIDTHQEFTVQRECWAARTAVLSTEGLVSVSAWCVKKTEAKQ